MPPADIQTEILNKGRGDIGHLLIIYTDGWMDGPTNFEGRTSENVTYIRKHVHTEGKTKTKQFTDAKAKAKANVPMCQCLC